MIPNFQKIIDNGFSSHLKVTVPHQTIPSWPCLFSGQEVDQLGYYTFIHPIKGIFNSSVWKEKSILSIPNLKIFALNIPGTYPAWKINGEMIAGILSPSFSCFPKDLKENLEENWIVEGKNLPEIIKAFEMKTKLFLRKIKEDFDLLVYVIRLPDAFSHNVIGNEKMISNYIQLAYKKIDDFLGVIIKENNFDNLIIFSDHGLKFYKKVLNFPRLLEKKGLLYFDDLRTKRLSNIFLKLYDVVRPFIKIHIIKKFYMKYFDYEKREIQIRKDKGIGFDDTGKPRTFVQKLTSNMGALFLYGNDRNRLDIIEKSLENDKYVKEIIKYNKSGFPDFLIVLNDKYILTKEPSFFIKRRTEVFSHTNKGLFLAFGKNIKKGRKELINYQDIAPTILKLYGIKKPEYMNGKILDILSR